eukprot:535116-Pelagomonas_calceolata.AAC.3
MLRRAHRLHSWRWLKPRVAPGPLQSDIGLLAGQDAVSQTNDVKKRRRIVYAGHRPRASRKGPLTSKLD